jgi:L-lactate dehydrogenase
MKIGVVGCGMVGSTFAYALLMSCVAREIVLVDMNRARAEAETNNISHAVPFAHPLTVRAGEYADLDAASVVVIAGGVAQHATIPLALDSTEREGLRRSANVLREAMASTESVLRPRITKGRGHA